MSKKSIPEDSSATVAVAGALFEQQKNEEDHKFEFPTEPAFVVPVEVRSMPQYGEGHYGVVAMEPIPAGTKFWVWTERVLQIPALQVQTYLEEETQSINDETKRMEAIRVLLRQGFVLPTNEDCFCSNPTDAGRFMNHSNHPNCGPDGALRDIASGEELTMDYSFHGNPSWYQEICNKYDVMTETQIANQSKK